jgi:hypothetical protein
MPTPSDLANSVRRIINRAVKHDRENECDKAALAYVEAAETSLGMAWLNATGENRFVIERMLEELQQRKKGLVPA